MKLKIRTIGRVCLMLAISIAVACSGIILPSGGRAVIAAPKQEKTGETSMGQFLYLPFDGDWAYQMSALLDHHFPNYLSDNPGQLHRIAFWQGGSFYSTDGEHYSDPAIRGYWSPEYEDYMWYDGHDGYDWKMNSGTPIRAAAGGQITYAGELNNWLGNVIEIDHGNGYKTRYAHLSRIDKTSGTVAAGEQIGLSGGASIDPGHGNSTGPHLHFSVFHYLPEHGWVITDPFGWDAQHGSTDLLVFYNGEQSQNLWVGGSPQTFGGGAQHPISTVPTNTQPMGGSPYMSPPPDVDNATFLADITIPDGTVVTASQALHKVWRVKNSGTSTWGSGYQLVFTGGDQMGAPSSVNVPGSVSPGQTVDLAVDMTAPSSPGSYSGHWKLRNPQGVYFGDDLWIDIVVQGLPGDADITVLSMSYPTTVSPGEQFRPEIKVRVNTGMLLESRGDMLRNTDDNLYGAWPHVSVVGTVNTGGEYTFQFYQDHPITAPTNLGGYDSRWRVWEDGHYVGPEITIHFEVQSGGGHNYPPNAPSLIAPPDYYVSDFGAPNLQAQDNGDPDGDPIAAYYFEIFDSHDNPNSGWIGQSNWTPPGLGLFGYKWHSRVKDSRGAESGWSATRQFLIRDPGPQIYDFHWEWCRDAWGGPEKICFCADTNAGTLRVQVNMAADGSANGEWHIINELGVPQYKCENDSDRPPNWDQLEAEAGNHLARLYARREGGWEAAATADIQIPLSPERRPSNPAGQQPPWEAFVSTQAIHFGWLESLRTTGYHLLAGTNPDPGQNPLLDVSFPSGTTEYDFILDQDYPTVYWRVTATGPYGTNDGGGQFHVDITPPTSAVSSLPPVTTDTALSVSWSGSDERSGLRWYDVQFRDGERGEWVTWLAQTTLTGAIFRGEAGHTYYFRCRAMDAIGNWEDYPPGDGDTHTLVDPTAVPPEAWWDEAYGFKRSILVLNNDGNTMPAGYPVKVHFDSGTIPTAAEMYDASQSATKGDDIRIVYDDTTELSRMVQAFTPSGIDIWFALHADLPGGQASQGQYQLYYGNQSAAAPPADLNTVFVPKADGNTMGLWHFQEGSGGVVHDTSGRNHDGSFASPDWTAAGKFGNAGVFNGTSSSVNFGHPADFNVEYVTLEGWINLASHPGNHPGVFAKEGAYYLELDGRLLYFTAQRAGNNGCGVIASEQLPLGSWAHFAATYDGIKARVYINGVQKGDTDCPGVLAVNGADLIAGYINRPAWLPAKLQHLRISNVARTDFPYARVVADPSVAAGEAFAQPGAGAPDLVLQNVATYPNPSGGVIVQAVLRNEGDAPTTNGFYNDLYVNHQPTGPGDLTGSVRFWIASPIEAGATVTLTTVLTDVNGLAGLAGASPLSETSVTLYSQTDSEGVVGEPDDGNNISPGLDICTATADGYEDDDWATDAKVIALGETQTHNMESVGDADWIRFTAEAGVAYSLATSNLGPASDTYLYLYGADGSTLLAANDDSGSSLASYIEWTAPAAGTYLVLVKHWNPSAGGCGTSYDIGLHETAVADFVGTPTSGSVPLEVTFTNESQGGYESSLWNFGDGITSTLESPVHIYSVSGTFTVTLTVSGLGGTDTLARPGYITADASLHADFSGVPTSGLRPLTVTFTNSSTGDFDHCSWSFGDGKTSEVCSPPNHRYGQAGSYTVSLTISGPGGTDTLARTNYISVLVGKAHVSSITMSYQSQSGKYLVTALVSIVNQNGQPVGGATVYAQWTLPNNSQKTQQARTNTSGTASLRIQSLQAGTYKICVTNVTRTNWAYDPDQNVETCDTLVVP